MTKTTANKRYQPESSRGFGYDLAWFVTDTESNGGAFIAMCDTKAEAKKVAHALNLSDSLRRDLQTIDALNK